MLKNLYSVIFLVLCVFFISNTNAQDWTSVTSGTTGSIWGIDYVDANNVWLCASNGDVKRSTDGGSTWIAAGNTGNGAYSIAALSSQIAVVSLGPSSGDGKIMRTTNGGTDWTQVYTAAGAWFNFVDNISSSLLWAQSDPIGGFFHIVKSTDGGVTWALAPNLPKKPAASVFGANGSFWRIDNTCWFGTGGSGATLANRVYKSVNGPDGPWTFATTTVQYVGTLAFHSASGPGITGFWNQTTLVNISTDGGATWTAQTTAIGTVNGLEYVVVTPYCWAATSTGIWETSDNGNTWFANQVPAGTVNMNVVRFFGNANVGLAGGDLGVLRKSALLPVVPVELTSFTASVNPLGQTVLNWVTATEINNRGFEIERREVNGQFITIGFVAGFGTTSEEQTYSYIDKSINPGLYSYRLKQIDFNGQFEYSYEIELEVMPPLTFGLDQNYPNPFNPNTNIKFSLSEPGNVKLAVYNTLGEEVAVLVDSYKEAGFYELNFNGANLSSGTYIYKLEAPGYVEAKKMILMK